MATPRRRDRKPFPISEDAWEALREAAAAVTYNLTDLTVYELRLCLRTPGIFSLYKADIPVAGLPMLDGFLKFLAFRKALAEAMQKQPGLGNELLWQWNVALRDPERWIEFPIPIREEILNNSAGIVIYDCSVGLPVTQDGDILYPAGAFFACGGNLVTYPSEEKGPADQVALRRRSVEPIYRPVELTVKKFSTQSGPAKALDNRIYYALTREYVFYFRGDKGGVERLLKFAIRHNIGIGKKTTLGYGRIAGFKIQSPNLTATLGHNLNILGMDQIALLKNVPYLEMQRRCAPGLSRYVPRDSLSDTERDQNHRLFGSRELRLSASLETFDRHRPPYWRREERTQVLRYGTLLIPRGRTDG